MEDWKDDILNSVRGMQKLDPPQDTFSKIQKKIRNQQPSQGSGFEWVAVAATISIIVLSNLLFINFYLKQGREASIDESYPELVSNYNLYENIQ